ncbi:hypothetical protein [Streptomyces sp. NBC_01217]|uniref:hypothetical protein n=1 Tax=Streptomyces sp. NBC_01217 TaxID=2903779 RepID=UPI002E15712E|nr:hypothetical protein OG507_39820 [Streptomyces sp. NBC_01217]
MSAVAAPAATLDHPLWEDVDNSVDDAPVGRSRRRLRSVPAAAEPGSNRAAGNPLSLGRDARARLGGTVRALLDVAGLDGASDAVRLAVVVLASRTPSETGVVEIRTSELGRWIGVSASYVASDVLPVLRRSSVVSVETTEGDYGQDTGLRCKVLPLWAAQDVVGHPLALAKREYATLLRLLEAVMAPGWVHKDNRVTPAGLIGTRTGRGAATDRLALLLLVLEARATGRVRLCGGSVDTKRGRAAATLARLMGCTAAAAAGILGRLEERELVFRVRLQTASGLANRSRLMVPAVAAAHGRTGADDVREDRAEALEPMFSERGVAARRSEPSQSDADPQVNGAPAADEADVAEPSVAAALHTDHPPLVTPIPPLSLSGGFSGEGRGGFGDLPDRACVREDGGPLRGEQPKKSPVVEGVKDGRGPVAGSPVRVVDGSGQGRQQRGRVALPSEDLRAVLAPVDLVWARLERPAARRLVEAAARRELNRVVGFVGRADAPQVLADRLARHLENQMRLYGPIKDSVGWLIGLALPQRQRCGDVRCDDRVLLDSGQDCPRCAEKQDDRRDQRRALAVAVDAAMPYASETERRAATEQQLHQDVTARAWAKAYEWEQHRARQTAAAQARAEAAAAQPADDVPAALVAPLMLPAPRPAAVVPAPESEPADVDDDQELVLEELTREQVLDWRNRAAADHQLVFDHIDRYGELSAQRLFTRAFVAQVQRLSGLGHLDLGYTTWGQA